MLIQSRLNRIIVATAGALAMTAPLAHAMPADAGGTAPSDTTTQAQSAAFGTSDAAQASSGEGVVVVRSSDRSDAAQRTPGETTPIRSPHRVPSPTVVADDGFEWQPLAIGGALVALMLIAAGAITLRPRRPLGQA